MVGTGAVTGERRFPERVVRNVVESMLGVAGADGLALSDGRPVTAQTGTVQSRSEGQNNDASTAGFTPTPSTSVWLGTDMSSPIRTANGTPISGRSLPGEVWQEFMGEVLDAEPVQTLAPFRAIGRAPADATPTGTAPTGVPPDEAPPPTTTVAPTPPPPGPQPAPTQDCSVTPCG